MHIKLYLLHDKNQGMDKIYFIFNAHRFKQVHGFISKRNGLIIYIIFRLVSSCKNIKVYPRREIFNYILEKELT